MSLRQNAPSQWMRSTASYARALAPARSPPRAVTPSTRPPDTSVSPAGPRFVPAWNTTTSGSAPARSAPIAAPCGSRGSPAAPSPRNVARVPRRRPLGQPRHAEQQGESSSGGRAGCVSGSPKRTLNPARTAPRRRSSADVEAAGERRAVRGLPTPTGRRCDQPAGSVVEHRGGDIGVCLRCSVSVPNRPRLWSWAARSGTKRRPSVARARLPRGGGPRPPPSPRPRRTAGRPSSPRGLGLERSRQTASLARRQPVGLDHHRRGPLARAPAPLPVVDAERALGIRAVRTLAERLAAARAARRGRAERDASRAGGPAGNDGPGQPVGRCSARRRCRRRSPPTVDLPTVAVRRFGRASSGRRDCRRLQASACSRPPSRRSGPSFAPPGSRRSRRL